MEKMVEKRGETILFHHRNKNVWIFSHVLRQLFPFNLDQIKHLKSPIMSNPSYKLQTIETFSPFLLQIQTWTISRICDEQETQKNTCKHLDFSHAWINTTFWFTHIIFNFIRRFKRKTERRMTTNPLLQQLILI